MHQPNPSRITPFARHPIVVGVTPGQSELVALTAANWADAVSAPVYFAYVDPRRVTRHEFSDGTVEHWDLDPDLSDDQEWRRRESYLVARLQQTLAGREISWEFRYLAGRVDRSLTHLARAVDAAAIVVGTRAPGSGARMHEVLEGSVAAHLSRHQHRPVLVVPLSVVDWKTRLS
jgi:nucleotide-binding universal stress UspA family protein